MMMMIWNTMGSTNGKVLPLRQASCEWIVVSHVAASASLDSDFFSPPLDLRLLGTTDLLSLERLEDDDGGNLVWLLPLYFSLSPDSDSCAIP